MSRRQTEPGEINGREVLRRRLDLGLTQTAFASVLGVGRKTVNMWENDRCAIQHARILDLALCEIERRLHAGGIVALHRAQAGILPPPVRQSRYMPFSPSNMMTHSLNCRCPDCDPDYT